jgi:hypothetical protein
MTTLLIILGVLLVVWASIKAEHRDSLRWEGYPGHSKIRCIQCNRELEDKEVDITYICEYNECFSKGKAVCKGCKRSFRWNTLIDAEHRMNRSIGGPGNSGGHSSSSGLISPTKDQDIDISTFS